jgi:hypothetical protein
VDVRIFLGPGGRDETAKDGRPPEGGVLSLAVRSTQPGPKQLCVSAKWGIPVGLDRTGFVATYNK